MNARRLVSRADLGLQTEWTYINLVLLSFAGVVR